MKKVMLTSQNQYLAKTPLDNEDRRPFFPKGLLLWKKWYTTGCEWKRHQTDLIDRRHWAARRTTSRSWQKQGCHMCCLAQKSSLCLLDRWLHSQREPFSWRLPCSAASIYGVGTGERGIRSYGCGVTRGHLATRGRWDSSIAGRRWTMFLKDKRAGYSSRKGTAGPMLTSWSFQESPLSKSVLTNHLLSSRKMLLGPSICSIFLFPDLSRLGSRERPSSIYYNFSLCSHLSQQL